MIKENIDSLIWEVKEGKKIADRIPETTDFLQWCMLANNPCYTICAVGNEDLSGLNSVMDKKAFSILGLDVPENDNIYIRVVSAVSTIFTNAEKGESLFENEIGVSTHLIRSLCSIKNSDSELSIVIDGKEYSRQDQGINIVIFENDYHYVVDSVTLKCNKEGNIKLVR